MSNKKGIIFVCSEKHVAESFVMVKNELEKIFPNQLKYMSICLDELYSGNGMPILRSNGIECLIIEKPFPYKNWWTHEKKSILLYRKFRAKIYEKIEKFLFQKNIRVCMMADDTGPVEKDIILRLNERGVKVLLMEHGFDFSLSYIRGEGNLIKSFLKYMVFRLGLQDDYLNVSLFGKNGNSTILAISKFTKNIYVKHGLKPSRIVVTGYPYFENFFHQKNNRHTKNRKHKILIVSTGWEKFGKPDNPFYGFIETYLNNLSVIDDFLVTIRPKPGEDKSFYKGLLRRNIYLSTTDNPAIDIDNSDLVIGDNSSMMLEAYVNKIPIMRIEYDSNERYTFGKYIVDRYLHPLTISLQDNYMVKTRYAMSAEYSRKLFRNYNKKIRLILGPYTNGSATEIAAVVAKLLGGEDFKTNHK